MKKILFLVSMSLITKLSEAQQASYFVDLIKGSAVAMRNHNALPLNYRSLIYETDTIVLLEKNTAITLVNRENQYIQLTGKRPYIAANLKNEPFTITTGISKKYLELLWDEFKKPEVGTLLTTQNIMGVKRAGCSIASYPLSGWVAAVDSLYFSWSPQEKNVTYKFVLQNENSTFHYNVTTSDTFVVLKENNLPVLRNTDYYWTISEVNNKCEDIDKNKFTFLSKTEYEKNILNIVAKIPLTDSPYYYVEIAKKMYAAGYFDECTIYLQKALAKK